MHRFLRWTALGLLLTTVTVCCSVEDRELPPAKALESNLEFQVAATPVVGPLPAGLATGPQVLALPASVAGTAVAAPGQVLILVVGWQGGLISAVNVQLTEDKHFAIPVPSAGNQTSGTIQIPAQVGPDVCRDLEAVCHQIRWLEQVVGPDGAPGLALAQQLVLDCAGTGCPSPQVVQPPPAVASGAPAPAASAPTDTITDTVGTMTNTPLAQCQPGESRCTSPNTVSECTAGGVWGPATGCPSVCSGTSCGGECSPGASECVTRSRVRTCSTDGVWSDAADCENACVDTSCGGECKPGLTRCASDASFETCDDSGAWGAVADCENACVDTACTGECQPGSTRCFSERELQTCNDLGQWQDVSACPNACIDGECGGSCSPGTRQCDPGGRVPQVCTAEGTLQAQTPCQFVCQGAGNCGGECSPGSRRCNPTSGIPQQCGGNGFWQNQQACPFVCSGAGNCTGECRPTSRRCNPQTGVPQLCSANAAWQDQTPCQFVCSGNGTCTGECRSGQRRCDSATGLPQICDGQGSWVNQPRCPFTCAGQAMCVGECLPGSTRCSSGGDRQVCNDSFTWVAHQTPCDRGFQRCEFEGQCLPCRRELGSQDCTASTVCEGENSEVASCQFPFFPPGG